jgi:ATP-binding cassette subfamily G (WHITE) protein 2
MLHGQIVYFGPSVNMVPHFTALNYAYKTSDNPADFALDVLNQATSAAAIGNLYERYRSSLNNGDIPIIFSDSASNHDISTMPKSDRSYLSDFLYVSQRTLRNALRNSALLAWQIAVAVILGLLTGLLYYKIPLTTGLGVQNRLGGIFFIVVNQIFSTATALEPFIKERALFMHASD